MSPFAAVSSLLLVAAPLAAASDKNADQAQVPVIIDVVACRAIADQMQRLACYDRTVDALDQAQKTNQISVMDRAQIHATRRSLFGFSLPKIGLFGHADDDQQEVSSLDAVVASTTRDQDSRLIFTIDGGARWHQSDDRPSFNVKRGTKVTINKAALGSYFANFHGANAIRVKRDN